MDDEHDRRRLGVVIPAHNGAASIDRSLGSLAAQTFAGGVEVVVVCNGCSDGTAAAARRWRAPFARRGWRLAVIESAPGRAAAINAGEAELGAVSAIAVVDQDALLAATTLEEFAQTLESGERLFAAPRLVLGPSHGLVGRYYRGWKRLPYVSNSPVTIGCYATSAAGRARWGAYPPEVPDDKFTRMQFAPEERCVTRVATYEVLLPADVRELIAARRRYAASNRALEREYPVLGARAADERRTGIWRWAIRPANWSGSLALLSVHVLAAFGVGR